MFSCGEMPSTTSQMFINMHCTYTKISIHAVYTHSFSQHFPAYLGSISNQKYTLSINFIIGSAWIKIFIQSQWNKCNKIYSKIFPNFPVLISKG